MAVLEVATTTKDMVYELLEASFAAGAWSLLDVCCMCASSKVLRSAWLQLLRQQPNPAWLLAAVADAADARTPALQAKATAVVRWLLNTLPGARLAEHPSIPAGLLTIPCMPPQLAKELCELGVRVPYQGIVAAARQCVEGVEVWLTVNSSMGLASDIPPNIKAWCNGVSYDCIRRVRDADWHDLLHLSINSSSATHAAAGADKYSMYNISTAQPTTAEALELLRTALERNHVDVILSLNLIKMGEFYPEQLLPMLERAIMLDANVGAPSSDRLRSLCALPAVHRLPAVAVAALMGKALEQPAFRHDVRTSISLQLLRQLPAANHINPTQLSSTVQAAAAKGDLNSVQLLAACPAFQELQPATVAAAVLAAVRAGNIDSLKMLLHSRPAATGEDVLVPALVLAVGTGNLRLLNTLLQVSGQQITYARFGSMALRFSADGFQQVLAAALKSNQMDIFRHLLSLPAAASLQGKHLGQLLRCAAVAPPGHCQGYSSAADVYLKVHPAWSSVSAADKLAWQLRQAVQAGIDYSPYLTKLHVSGVDMNLAGRLLELAVSTQHSSNLKALLQLPACAKLDSSTVQQLLRSAVTAVVRSSIGPAARCLNNWRFPQAAPTAEVGTAVNASRQQETSSTQQGGERNTSGSNNPVDAASDCLSVLCQWEAAIIALDAPGWFLARAMKIVMPLISRAAPPPTTVVQQLCGSKAAASISSAQDLSPLLELAIAGRDAVSVQLLLQCPGAASITPAFLGQLLPAAFTYYDSAMLGAGALGHAKQFVDVTAEQLVELLRAAVQQQDSPTAAALCSSPAAAQLDTAAMHELLLAAAAVPLQQEPSINDTRHLEDQGDREPARAVGGSSVCQAPKHGAHGAAPFSTTWTAGTSTWSMSQPQPGVAAPVFAFGANKS